LESDEGDREDKRVNMCGRGAFHSCVPDIHTGDGVRVKKKLRYG